ncbi:MAG: signal recognition particle protein [Parachlamydiales bacterium]|nr:signal recognition particle protein [Parachlamydiales bacterium]
MFESITGKLQNLFTSLKGNRQLTESNLSDAIRTVRLTLLEADVHYSVANAFVQKIKEEALGRSLLQSITPGQQFIQIVHEALITFLGSEEVLLHLENKPTVIMLCGLQGSGKTTTAAKLAYHLGGKKKKVLLAACDVYRPAAVDQLRALSESNHLSLFFLEESQDPVDIAQKALSKARADKFDVLIVDTAGRLHLDEGMMEELVRMKESISPKEILFVANATTGQDAVNTAASFDKKIAITGTILTMLDGDARGGAAISIREVTKKPLKFEGIGEHITDFQPFNPRSMADRILGMGDVINLVKKAQDLADADAQYEVEKKLKKGNFTYRDYLQQMGMIKKMGSFTGLLKMIPGVSALGNIDLSDAQFKKTEAMILSMTVSERKEEAGEMGYSRRKRIALGSGCTIEEVNRMIKGFKRIKQLMKNMPKKGMLDKLQQFGGHKLWR